MRNEIDVYSIQPTSAYNAHLHGQALSAIAEDRTRERRGIQAQIDSANRLVDLRQELAAMRMALDELRIQNLEQSKHLLERDKLDTERSRENILVSKIAAWAGVISVLIMAAQWVLGK